MKSDIGLIGIGVMGKNLAINFTNHDYKISIYDIDIKKINLAKSELPQHKTKAFYKLETFIESLKTPRKIMLMIKSGDPVDRVIDEILPLLDEQDIIIDGGNSHFKDTIRRFNRLKQLNIEFIGMGISGGAKGAKYGPSIMPGGSSSGWKEIKPIYQNIAAKTKKNIPCCLWMSSDGAGHFVKTVHNGIEYSIMQLIAEVYHILSEPLELPNNEISEIFTTWNKGRLHSYLIEITGNIFSKKEKGTDQYVIDLILDKAGQKGTGRWSVHTALDNASASTMIASAVFQRIISGDKLNRQKLSDIYNVKQTNLITNRKINLSDIEASLYLATLVSYIQGFELLKKTADKYTWELSFENISMVWQNGCIIRSDIIEKLTEVFEEHSIDHLMKTDFVKDIILTNIKSLKKLQIFAVENMIPTPGFSSSLNYLTSILSERLPANLIQAQRDYFGSHGYQRIDDKENLHHTSWED